ncbi:unnamed protein product [Prorocentrum cordatum]|uniref:Pentacotripeptide-repeat region of PRORP domain-containing protein n=1 Tax=Prorocentrum cordatum TaxID=2364126 RepID=A0ABN9PB47_9DINO|nr:unnamed protein product [Polarella glacialis]
MPMGFVTHMLLPCRIPLCAGAVVALASGTVLCSTPGDTTSYASWLLWVTASLLSYFLGRYASMITGFNARVVQLFTTSSVTDSSACDGGQQSNPAATTQDGCRPRKKDHAVSEYPMGQEQHRIAYGMRLMECVQAQSVSYNARTVRKVMITCNRLEDGATAVKLFDLMLDRGAVSNAHAIAKPVSDKFFNLVVCTLNDKRIREDGPRLIDLIQAHGLSPPATTQNRLLLAFGNILPESILRCFVTMLNGGGILSIWAYRYIVVAHQWSDPAFALKVFDEMEELGYKADRAAYNAILVACCQLGMHEIAQQLFMQMADRALKPNAKSYSTMVKSYLFNNEPEKALALFATMRGKCFKPDRFAYHHAILSCIALERIQYGVELYEDAVTANIALCAYTYVALTSACQEFGRHELVDKIMADMARAQASDVEQGPASRALRG